VIVRRDTRLPSTSNRLALAGSEWIIINWRVAAVVRFARRIINRDNLNKFAIPPPSPAVGSAHHIGYTSGSMPSSRRRRSGGAHRLGAALPHWVPSPECRHRIPFPRPGTLLGYRLFVDFTIRTGRGGTRRAECLSYSYGEIANGGGGSDGAKFGEIRKVVATRNRPSAVPPLDRLGMLC
jgi:hypothetical protein